MGVGGEEVAGRATDAGLDVLAVEQYLIGGECAYWGCIPTKSMVRAANAVGEAKRGQKLAGDFSVTPSWDPVALRVREVTGSWDDEVAIERYEKRGTTIIKAPAHLTGAREVEIDGSTYAARKGIVIATGSSPAIPPIPGLESVDYWTNQEAVAAEEPPASLVILGGGAIGVEFGQVFARFGSKVTIIERAPHLLPPEEPENGAALGRVLESDGITVLTGKSAQSIAPHGGGVRVQLDDGSNVDADKVLVATGRQANVHHLNLEAAGLDGGARTIAVDENMRAGDGLWAIGDVTGGGFTHVAVYEGRIAAADILGRDHAPADLSAVPHVTFTDPEVASVGLSEEAARGAGIEVKTAVSPTNYSSRGWIHGPGAEEGVIKLVADARTNTLVGGSIMSPSAGEMLGILVLAVKEKIPIASLRELIYPYPTFVRGLEDPLRELEEAR
jgi:pyruvate/2-oxoglutarate dehydrogenase complex dihydrolipoamide dehydrogenase (E3) component